MENILWSIFVALVLAVGLSIVVFLPAYLQAAKQEAAKQERERSQRKAVKKGPGKFTVEEVAKHQSGKDCWLIVNDQVFDVTEYVLEHPGGDSILNNAGGENTKAFFGPQHPTWAHDRIKEYYIGELVSQGQE